MYYLITWTKSKAFALIHTHTYLEKEVIYFWSFVVNIGGGSHLSVVRKLNLSFNGSISRRLCVCVYVWMKYVVYSCKEDNHESVEKESFIFQPELYMSIFFNRCEYMWTLCSIYLVIKFVYSLFGDESVYLLLQKRCVTD